jgi:integrase
VRRRRANGEGTLYRRKDGRWEGKVTVAIVGRRQVRQSVYGKTQAEARERRDALKASIAAGRYSSDRVTVEEWQARWVKSLDEALNKGRIAYRTHESYVQKDRDYVRHPELGLRRAFLNGPNAMDADRLEQWMDDLEKAGVAAPTIKASLTVLRISMRAAKRAKVLLGEDPSRLVKAPTWRKRKQRPFLAAEAKEFLAAIREHRLYALFLLDVTTGLRRGELIAPRWRALEPELRLLWIHEQIQRQTGKGLVFVPTKTERSEAPVVLPQFVVRELEAHRARMREERLAMGPEWEGADDPGAPDALIFTTHTGKPLAGEDVWRTFKRLLRRHQMPDRSLHAGGRGTLASILRAMGVPLEVIKDVLRQSQLSTTLLYAQGDLSERVAVADKLDDLLAGHLG